MKAPNLNPPTSEDVRAARDRAKLTQLEAATLVHVTYETWRSWEAPEGSAKHRNMPIGSWELFQLKTKPAPRRRS